MTTSTTDRITPDGVRLSSEAGGYIAVYFPASWVDDLGQPFRRTYHVRGWDRAEDFVGRARAWQPITDAEAAR